MTTIIIKVDVSQLDAEDQRAIKAICDKENERRQAASLELLPFDTAPQRKAFYEQHLANMVGSMHAQSVDQAAREIDRMASFKTLRSAWADASPEQRAAALKAMTTPVTG